LRLTAISARLTARVQLWFPADLSDRMEATVIQMVLLYFVLPLWVTDDAA
jgi:hypothetical protein